MNVVGGVYTRGETDPSRFVNDKRLEALGPGWRRGQRVGVEWFVTLSDPRPKLRLLKSTQSSGKSRSLGSRYFTPITNMNGMTQNTRTTDHELNIPYESFKMLNKKKIVEGLGLGHYQGMFIGQRHPSRTKRRHLSTTPVNRSGVSNTSRWYRHSHWTFHVGHW